LDTLVAEKLISPQGKNWLIEAMDPYHDDRITLTGYPDTNVAESVILCVKKTMPVSVATQSGAGLWDCNICMFNSEHQSTAGSTSLFGPGAWNNGAILSSNASGLTNYPACGVCAYQSVAGFPTYGSSAATFSQNIPLSNDATPYLAQNARVIAKGFEVINTTSELNKQGTVTIYRQPMPDPSNLATVNYNANSTLADERKEPKLCLSIAEYQAAAIELRTLTEKIARNKTCCERARGSCAECQQTGPLIQAHCPECHATLRIARAKAQDREETLRAGLPTVMGTISTYYYPAPPGTLAQAILLPSSQQWPAKDGCYLIAPMNTQNNVAKVLSPLSYAAVEGETADGSLGLVMCCPGINQASAVTQVLVPSNMVHVSPFDLVGAYFTGLSQQTTLTVNACWYVEVFPTPWDSILAPLGSKSPGFDPLAIEIYGRALSSMPIGVPQGMNPMGEWFKSVLNAVRDVAVPVGRVVGNFVPGVGAVTEVVDQVAKSLRPVAKKAVKRERKQNVKAIKGRPGPPGTSAGPGGTFKSK